MGNETKALKTFYQDVDMRNRKEMIDFLSGHFRYNTMNSWNRSTSYANKVKIWDVIPSDLQDKVFEMMDAEGFYDDINDILEIWAFGNEHNYQAGFNGRSGGYIVMYEGSIKYKTIFKFENTNQKMDYADGYGWMDIEEAKERGLYCKQIKVISSYPGRSIDMGEDFEEWSMDGLRKRVELVQSFDRMCDEVVASVIHMAKESEVIEETVMIPKKIKYIQ